MFRPLLDNIHRSFSSLFTQGGECDVIVFSFVRSAAPGSPPAVGFMNDVRRINVITSRAKQSFWVVGDSKTMRIDETWERFIRHCSGPPNCVRSPYDGAHIVYATPAAPPAGSPRSRGSKRASDSSCKTPKHSPARRGPGGSPVPLDSPLQLFRSKL
jgi:hypothetical protein